MSSPALSVVIPTYRRPQALGRTLAALAKQSVASGFEVVICDDGSPPDEAEAIRALAAQYRGAGAPTAGPASVRLIRQENAGPAAARNAGAKAAAAPLLLFLDDDCAPVAGLVALHLREHAAQPGVAVMGRVAWSPDLRVTPFMELVVRGAQFNYAAIVDPEDAPFTCFYTANCSLRRVDLERAGWFDAALPPFMEDTEFGYRLRRSGTRIVYRPDAVVYHEHSVELHSYLDRQHKAGRAAVQVALRHPELFDVVGVGDVADVTLREQFYTALLRYAFVTGVESGLADLVKERHITGAELRSRFESWLAQWSVRRAERIRALGDRVRALELEIAQRDRRLSEVTQAKDARIAMLEAQLERFHRLPPVRLYQLLRRRLRLTALVRHNG